MPWTKRRKKSKEERIKDALVDLANGMTLREAGLKHELNYGTIYYRSLKKNVLKKNAISHEEELLILEMIERRQKGTPLTKSELIESVNQYLKIKFPSAEMEISNAWFEKFKRKYKSCLSIKKPISRSEERITAEDPSSVLKFLDTLDEYYKKENITPDRIWNMDESPFFYNLNLKKVVAIKNSPQFQKTKEGEHVTLVCCISAAGKAMVPTVIFKGKTIVEAPTHGFNVACSENGWVDTKIKEAWLDLFIKDKPQGPVILLIDGHSSNFTLEIEQKAKQNEITLIQFPSNSTHLLQPLDSNFFRILKDNLRYSLNEFAKKNTVNKYSVLQILEDPWHKATAPGTIRKSFEIPGIFPIDKMKWEDYFSFDKKGLMNTAFATPPNPETTSSKSTSVISVSYSQVNFKHLISNLLEVNQNDTVTASSQNEFTENNIPSSTVVVPFNQNTVPSSSQVVASSSELSLMKNSIVVENNVELFDQLFSQINELKQMIAKPKKNRINSSKEGSIITAPEMEKKLVDRKRKKLQEENKKLKVQLQQNTFELSILPPLNSSSVSNSVEKLPNDLIEAPPTLLIELPPSVEQENQKEKHKKKRQKKIEQFIN